MLVAQSMGEHPGSFQIPLGWYIAKGGRLENVRQSHPSSLKDDEMSLAQNAPLNQARELPQPSRSKAGDATRLCTGRAEMAGATGAKPEPALHSELAQAKELCITRRRSRLQLKRHRADVQRIVPGVLEQCSSCLRGSSERQSQLALVQFHQRRHLVSVHPLCRTNNKTRMWISWRSNLAKLRPTPCIV